MDERVCVCVEKGWTIPATTVVGIVIPIEVVSWSKADLDECNWNGKRLQALFMVVCPQEFRRLSICEAVKKVWDSLEITHKGTKIVKNYELQVLITRFEEISLRMMNHLIISMRI